MIAQPDHRSARPSAVKKPLTVGRRRDVVENDEFAAFARRVLAAYGRRVAAGDVEALVPMVALVQVLDDAIGQAVTGLRSFGYSWAEIATRLGITRQAVHQRWARPTATPTTRNDHGGASA